MDQLRDLLSLSFSKSLGYGLVKGWKSVYLPEEIRRSKDEPLKSIKGSADVSAADCLEINIQHDAAIVGEI